MVITAALKLPVMCLFDFAVVCKHEADNVAALIICGHTEGREAPAVSSQVFKVWTGCL